MTRIETLFGGLLAVAIFGIFAFVFFGQAETATRPSATMRTAQGPSMFFAGNDEYAAPSTPCECWDIAYKMGRKRMSPMDTDYQSQLTICAERLKQQGAAAFEAGFISATDRERGERVCRPAAYAND